MKVLIKEKGVSEVLGSILVLLITVTLFSSVFYYINTIPAPKSGTYAEFDATLQMVEEHGKYYANITLKNMGGESLNNGKTMLVIVIDATVDRHMLTEFGNQSFAKDNYFSQGEEIIYNSSWFHIPATPVSTISIMLYDKSTSQVIWEENLQGKISMPGVLVGVMSNPTPILLGKRATITAIIANPNPGGDVSQYKVGIDLSSLNESSYVPMKYAGNDKFITPPILFKDTTLNVKKSYKVIVHIEDFRGRNVSYSAYLYVTRGTSIKGADVFIDPSLVTLSDA
ncbi:MAG: type IV pilin, partial [Euryarchaeota archaeon]|nr:type IV pilin [Euryarchaeota archaeon]